MITLYEGEKYGVTAVFYEGGVNTWDGTTRAPSWSVHLPHNCDEWVIADDTDLYQVADDLSAFIWELRMAYDVIETEKKRVME